MSGENNSGGNAIPSNVAPTSPAAGAGDAGGSAAPSPASDPWASLADGGESQDGSFDGGGSSSDGTDPGTAPTLPPAQPPVSPPPAAPQLPAPQAVQPPAQPAQPQQPVEGQPQAEEPGMLDPQWVESGLNALTQGYTLTREQAQAYEDNPSGALPALAARVHMNVLQQAAVMTHHAITNVVPKLVQQALTQYKESSKVEQTMETRVFSKYPELRKVPAGVMKSIATVLRDRMPNASFDEGMAEAAKIAYGMYNWPLPGAPTQPQPAAPAAPPAPPPYVPVAPGASAPVAVPNGQAPGNAFADLLDPRQ